MRMSQVCVANGGINHVWARLCGRASRRVYFASFPHELAFLGVNRYARGKPARVDAYDGGSDLTRPFYPPRVTTPQGQVYGGEPV